MTEPVARPRRRVFAFGLRAMMILVLVVSVFLAWKVNRAKTQARAVAAIEKGGDNVVYDYTFDGEYPPKYGEPRAPERLRRAVGDVYFREVTGVVFHANTEDDKLAALDDLDHLLGAEFFDSGNVTDAGLAHLGNLRGLRRVLLQGTQITDAGLAVLAPLPRLERLLLLRNPRVTDAGMESARQDDQAPQAGRDRRRDHRGRRGAPGVAHEVGEPQPGRDACRRRRVLAAERAHPTPRARPLAHEPDRRRPGDPREVPGPRSPQPSTGSPAWLDAGLVHLAGLAKVRKLDLSGTAITYAGLTNLRGLPALLDLGVEGVPTSPAEVASAPGRRNPGWSFGASPPRAALCRPGPPVVDVRGGDAVPVGDSRRGPRSRPGGPIALDSF